jgi:mono/diheme cytochrome c family protein
MAIQERSKNGNAKARKHERETTFSCFRLSCFRVSLLLAACLLAGCQQQMAKQPKYLPLEASEFFEDGRSARPLIAGTVARGHLHTDEAFYAGKLGPSAETIRAVSIIGAGSGNLLSPLALALSQSAYVDVFPFPVTLEVLSRGRERFTIFCAVCHGPLGDGDGVVVERGFTRPPTYHSDRLRSAPVGYFYDVITHGFGSMPDYSAQVSAKDRWAIAAYIRALQLSQNARLSELPPEERKAATAALEGQP